MSTVETQADLSTLLGAEQDPLGLTPLPPDNRTRYLRFMLGQSNDALLPLDQIVEVMRISIGEIFPIPDMPSCILGVCSWQGETLWLVDFNHFVGYEPLSGQAAFSSQLMVIVVQFEGRSLGLVVEQVDEVDFFDQVKITMTSGLCSPGLEPFVLGYCPGRGGTVLNVAAIVSAPLWQSHGGQSRERPSNEVSRFAY